MLIITPIDLEKLTNNLEHHRIRYYRDRGCRVTVVSKVMNQSPRFGDLLRDTLLFSTKTHDEDGVRYITVDPPFNYFAGLRRNAEAEIGSTGAKRSRLRIGLIRLLSPLSVLRDVFAAPWMGWAARRATRDGCDVCLAFGPWGGVAARMAQRSGRVGTLAYEDRDYEAGLVPDRLRQGYTAALERQGIRRADVTFSISHLLSDLRRNELGAATHVIPSGVDRERYASARATVSSRRALIYVGNVIGWSGLEHAILAMPRILQVYPDAQLDIVGSGVPNFVGHFERLAEEHAPDGAVRFLGARAPEELPGLLADARIGLANAEPVPFRRYATPLKVIEYLAAGLPVITTEDTEAGDIVTRRDCGAAIPYESDALAEAAIRLFDDDVHYDHQRNNAIEHSRQYDWDHLLTREAGLIAACRARSDR